MQSPEVAAVVVKVAQQLLLDDAAEDDGGIAEESVAAVMRWLELEIKLPAGAAVLALPARFVMASGSVESCGPALSGPASTVMASVDARAAAPVPPAVPWPWPAPAPNAAAADKDPDDDDDEWAMQLLTDGPAAEMLCGSMYV